MEEQLVISSFCSIKSNSVLLDGDIVYKDTSDVKFADFIKAAYKQQNINYPKFFKMDSLSKLGFLTAELLLNNDKTMQSFKGEETGMIILNSASSLDTDINYHETIKDRSDYFPSPAVFVYTLPNIMIGEICIKHKITGENSFFISELFNADFINNYVSDLFSTNKVNCCIAGWVDLIGNSYDSILYLIKKRKDCIDKTENIKFDEANLERIYLK